MKMLGFVVHELTLDQKEQSQNKASKDHFMAFHALRGVSCPRRWGLTHSDMYTLGYPLDDWRRGSKRARATTEKGDDHRVSGHRRFVDGFVPAAATACAHPPSTRLLQFLGFYHFGLFEAAAGVRGRHDSTRWLWEATWKKSSRTLPFFSLWGSKIASIT